MPVLPIAIEGSRDCLPKGGWRFGDPKDIHIRVLDAIDTSGLGSKDAVLLRDRVRSSIIDQVAVIRGASVNEVDAALPATRDASHTGETDRALG